MIKRKVDINTVQLLEFKGGKGSVDLIKFMESEDNCGKGRFFAYCTLPQGCSLGYHQHNGEFETYYFLKGTAKVCDNGTEEILGPGDCMVCYDGCSHSLENIGDCDLEYIAIILNS